MQGTRAMFEQRSTASATPAVKPAWKTAGTQPKPPNLSTFSTPGSVKPSQIKFGAPSVTPAAKNVNKASDGDPVRPPRVNKPSVGSKPSARSSTEDSTLRDSNNDQSPSVGESVTSPSAEPLSSVQAAKRALGLQQAAGKGPPLKNANVDSSAKPNVHLKPTTSDKPSSTGSSARSSVVTTSSSDSSSSVQSDSVRHSRLSVTGANEDSSRIRSGDAKNVACSINQQLAAKFMQQASNSDTEKPKNVMRATHGAPKSKSPTPNEKDIGDNVESKESTEAKNKSQDIDSVESPADSGEIQSNKLISPSKLKAGKLVSLHSNIPYGVESKGKQSNSSISSEVPATSPTSPPLLPPPRRHSKAGGKPNTAGDMISSPASKTPGSIFVDKQGRRFKKLAPPKSSQAGKIPRKLARPPNVDLSQYRSSHDNKQERGTQPATAALSNGTTKSAIQDEDDEIYDDATSATDPVPMQQEQKQQNGQYVEGLTRVPAIPPHSNRNQAAAAAAAAAAVIPADDEDSDMEEIYEEI